MEGFYPVKHWMAGYNLMLWDVKIYRYGGEGGIRTPGTHDVQQISSLSP